MSLGRPTCLGQMSTPAIWRSINFLTNHPLRFLAGLPLYSLLNYKTLSHHSKFTYLQIPFFHSLLANTSRETWLWEEAVHWFY